MSDVPVAVIDKAELALARSPLSLYGIDEIYHEHEVIFNFCANCKKNEEKKKSFKVCLRCCQLGVKPREPLYHHYCSKECQTAHWKIHRVEHITYEKELHKTKIVTKNGKENAESPTLSSEKLEHVNCDGPCCEVTKPKPVEKPKEFTQDMLPSNQKAIEIMKTCPPTGHFTFTIPAGTKGGQFMLARKKTKAELAMDRAAMEAAGVPVEEPKLSKKKGKSSRKGGRGSGKKPYIHAVYTPYNSSNNSGATITELQSDSETEESQPSIKVSQGGHGVQAVQQESDAAGKNLLEKDSLSKDTPDNSPTNNSQSAVNTSTSKTERSSKDAGKSSTKDATKTQTGDVGGSKSNDTEKSQLKDAGKTQVKGDSKPGDPQVDELSPKQSLEQRIKEKKKVIEEEGKAAGKSPEDIKVEKVKMVASQLNVPWSRVVQGSEDVWRFLEALLEEDETSGVKKDKGAPPDVKSGNSQPGGESSTPIFELEELPPVLENLIPVVYLKVNQAFDQPLPMSFREKYAKSGSEIEIFLGQKVDVMMGIERTEARTVTPEEVRPKSKSARSKHQKINSGKVKKATDTTTTIVKQKAASTKTPGGDLRNDGNIAESKQKNHSEKNKKATDTTTTVLEQEGSTKAPIGDLRKDGNIANSKRENLPEDITEKINKATDTTTAVLERKDASTEAPVEDLQKDGNIARSKRENISEDIAENINKATGTTTTVFERKDASTKAPNGDLQKDRNIAKSKQDNHPENITEKIKNEATGNSTTVLEQKDNSISDLPENTNVDFTDATSVVKTVTRTDECTPPKVAGQSSDVDVGKVDAGSDVDARSLPDSNGSLTASEKSQTQSTNSNNNGLSETPLDGAATISVAEKDGKAPLDGKKESECGSPLNVANEKKNPSLGDRKENTQEISAEESPCRHMAEISYEERESLNTLMLKMRQIQSSTGLATKSKLLESYDVNSELDPLECRNFLLEGAAYDGRDVDVTITRTRTKANSGLEVCALQFYVTRRVDVEPRNVKKTNNATFFHGKQKVVSKSKSTSSSQESPGSSDLPLVEYSMSSKSNPSDDLVSTGKFRVLNSDKEFGDIYSPEAVAQLSNPPSIDVTSLFTPMKEEIEACLPPVRCGSETVIVENCLDSEPSETSPKVAPSIFTYLPMKPIDVPQHKELRPGVKRVLLLKPGRFAFIIKKNIKFRFFIHLYAKRKWVVEELE